ncbi:MAG: phytanoyl-CoA dioxygenase family protein [Novosphingobium sp.]|nr:phytanoyl-CoA dioxygenase family protein [Novosphingobium sp.]
MGQSTDTLPPGIVTEAMTESFATLGYAKVPGLLNDFWIDHLRGAMDDILSDSFVHSPQLPGKRGNTNMLHNHSAFRQFMQESPLAAGAAAVMRSASARYYEDILVYVEEGWDDQGGWHQDTPTWPLQGSQFTNCWFALEKVTAATGALRVVAGSHLGPFYEPGHIGEDRREAFEHDRYLWTGGPVPDVNADPDRFPVTAIETDPGDVVIFHPTALHQGFGTPVGGPRRTFTVRLFGDDVGWHRKQCVYHPWMRDAPFADGEVPDDPRLPLIWAA